MAKELEHILNECIGRLLRGESVEQCLQDYPERAAELEPLLRVALVTQKASAIEPRPEFKAQARYEMQSVLSGLKKRREPRRIYFLGWQPRLAVVLIVCLLVAFIASGSGIVAASTNSLPDETLYPVKMATERVQMALTFSDMGKAKLNMKFAQRRIQELARMVEKEKSAQDIEKAAIDLTPRIVNSLEKLEQLAAEQNRTGASERLGELKELLQQNVNNTQTLLQAIEQKAPELTNRTAVKEFISNTRVMYEQALQAAGVSPEEIQKVESGGATGNTTAQLQDGGINQPEVSNKPPLAASNTTKTTCSPSGEPHSLSSEQGESVAAVEKPILLSTLIPD